MGVSLSKGANVSLTKAAPGLTAVVVGLGWDVRTTTGSDYDLDASAIMVNAGGSVIQPKIPQTTVSRMRTGPARAGLRSFVASEISARTALRPTMEKIAVGRAPYRSAA